MEGLQIGKKINDVTDLVVNELKGIIEKKPNISLTISNPQSFGMSEMYGMWLRAINEEGRILYDNKSLSSIPKEVADNLLSRRSIFMETLKSYGIHGKVRLNGYCREF